jgi:prolycopene isomerase
MTPANSAVVVMTATRADVGCYTAAHETFLYPRWDEHRGVARDIAAGRPAGVWICVPTLLDPALAPPGEHLVIISAPAAYDLGRPWEEEKGRFTEALLNLVEAYLPGYRAGLTHLESATPPTLARHTGNSGGAMYGWENVPLQTGTKRLAHRTPLPGLYLAGHWSLPGSGSLRVFASGLNAAQLILGERGVAAPTFAEANLPAPAG